MEVKNVEMEEYTVACIDVKIHFDDKESDDDVDEAVEAIIQPLYEAGYEQTNLEEFYELEDGKWNGYYIAYLEKITDASVR